MLLWVHIVLVAVFLPVLSGPRMLGSSVKSTWISAALCPGIRTLNGSNSSTNLPILFQRFFSAYYWADCPPHVLRKTSSEVTKVTVSGVAQVVCHGVKVVGVHGEEGREEDSKVQGEVKGATQRETLIMDSMWMKVRDSRDLSQCGCGVSVTKKTNI